MSDYRCAVVRRTAAPHAGSLNRTLHTESEQALRITCFLPTLHVVLDSSATDVVS
jgi:hypothetical protein